MKTIVTIIFLCVVALTSTSYGQSTSNNKQKVKMLFVVNYDSKKTVTDLLIVATKDIAGMDLPDKSRVAKDLGPVNADVVSYVTLKPYVKQLIKLPALLEAYNISAEDKKLPVRVDGMETLSNDILAEESEVYQININKAGNYIDIITKTAHSKSSK